MASLYFVFVTTVLFSAFTGHSITPGAALPAAQLDDDGGIVRDTLSTLLSDVEDGQRELVSGPLMARRSSVLDHHFGDEEGAPKMILVSDSRIQGLNPAFSRALPLLAGRNPAYSPREFTRRESSLDRLRCMVGRVYRPCWQS